MKDCYGLLTTLLLGVLAGRVMAHDPGLPDTLRVEEASLAVGVSSPVEVLVINDSAIVSWDVALLISSLDSAAARFDSVRFVGRLADPSVQPLRIVNSLHADGALPDTLVLAMIEGLGNPLPSGNDPVLELYFTGMAPGLISIDTSTYPPGSADFTHRAGEYEPAFLGAMIEVVTVDRPPDCTVWTSQPVIGTIQERISFDVSASSPSAIPVQVVLRSFAAADDSSRVPVSPPQFDTAASSRFRWTPGLQDVGIFKAVFVATDSADLATVAEVEIQTVTDDRYLTVFDLTSTDSVPHATGLVHGNLNDDPQPEILVVADPSRYRPSFATFAFSGDGTLGPLFSVPGDYVDRGLNVAYLNGDGYLDAVMCHRSSIRALRGLGDGSFLPSDGQPSLPSGPRGGTLTDYDGDASLDYALAAYRSVVVYRGVGELRFDEALAFGPGDTALTINSADFNGDGRDDLAVGTRTGLEIYLNDGQGHYELRDSHLQEYGTLEIEVTNQGNDFNEDGIFDLCLATPSVGGAYSELMLYLGRGDGTFDQSRLRRIRGQIFASRTGDFNGDAHLDIVFVNGAQEYVSIIFGDGRGDFINERRYRIPDNSPRQVGAVDFDLDGDMDVLVAAYRLGIELHSSFYLFENQLNPSGLSRSTLTVYACNNAAIELRAPGGGRLSRIANSLASAEYYPRSLDNNEHMDAIAVSRTVESGRYDLIAAPRKNLAAGEPFSLEYRVEGDYYRLAHQQSMADEGYTFPLYPGCDSPVKPMQGAFIQTALPTFTWESGGVDRFELSSDLGFVNILESATVSGGMYTLQMVLPAADSTPYFWRIRPEFRTSENRVFVFNVVRTPTGVDEPDQDPLVPDSCWLAQNYPNPFNPVTTIGFYLPHSARISITIHNVLGQLIRTLVDQTLPSGDHSVDWDATDLYGRPVASGIYFYRMQADDYSSTRKMVFVR